MKQGFLETVVFIILMMSLPWSIGFAQEETAPLNVPRINSEPEIDGNLEEPYWRNALKLELKYEVNPAENIEAPVRTEVYLAYNKTHLFIAFRALDPRPDEIRANFLDRDSLFQDDWLGVILDTFNDEKRSLNFFCNPLGMQADLVEFDNMSGSDIGWDALWDSAGKLHSWGYAVEMAIPFSQLEFQEKDGEQIWGFDAIRSYPRAVRHHLGLFPRERNNACYLCQAVKLKGFAGIEKGKKIEINPTLTTIYSQHRPDFPNGDLEKKNSNNDLGLTGSWGITNNINMAATLNPDYSQIEADAAQIDVNRNTALYFQEKRLFFLKESDFFRTRLNLVYTRAMVNPNWGTKISGKEGSHTFAGYFVEDDFTNLLIPGTTYSRSTSLAEKNTSSIVRYKKDFGSRNTIGVLFTGRESDNYHNRVLSLDGKFWLSEKDSIQIQHAASFTQYPGEISGSFAQENDDFNGQATDIFYTHSGRNINAWGKYQSIDNSFRSDLGYIPLVNQKNYMGAIAYQFIPDERTWWSSAFIRPSYTYHENQQGEKLLDYVQVEASINLTKQTSISIATFSGEQFYGGKYFDNNYFDLNISSTPNGSFSVGTYLRYGDQIDYNHARPGSRLTINPYFDIRVNKSLFFRGGLTWERMSVDEGELYNAGFIDMVAYYQFDARSYLKVHLKHMRQQFDPQLYAFNQDPENKDLYLQLMYSYKINPRSVLYLGYIENQMGNDLIPLTTKDRTVFLKLGYSWQL